MTRFSATLAMTGGLLLTTASASVAMAQAADPVIAPAPADLAAQVEAGLNAARAAYGADKADEAVAALEATQGLIVGSEGEQSPRLALPLNLLARIRIDQGRYPEALALIDRGLAVNSRAEPAAPIVQAGLLYDKAKAFDALGRNEEAETTARQSYDLRVAHLGQVHEKTADALNLYANALAAQGRYAEADPAYRQVLGLYEVLHGPKDFHLAIVLSNLGNALRRTGRGREASPLYRRAVSVAEVSDDPVLLAQCLTNYGWYLHTQGDGVKAEIQFRRALDLAIAVAGPDHPFTGVVHANIGHALSDQGRYAEAEPEFARALALLDAGLGPDSPDVVDTLAGYAGALSALGRPGEAEPLFMRARTITMARLAPGHPDSLTEANLFAGFLLDQDRPSDAMAELRTALDALLRRQTNSDGGRDWRTSVRGAGPLFERQVEAAWRLAGHNPAI